MIAGIGSDLVEQSRIAASLERFGPRFLDRLLTERERALYQDRSPLHAVRFVAQRFAAKEAFAKALGSGIGPDLGWRDVGVHNEPSGKPVLHWSAGLAERLRAKGIGPAHVTLTDEAGFTHALVLLEQVT